MFCLRLQHLHGLRILLAAVWILTISTVKATDPDHASSQGVSCGDWAANHTTDPPANKRTDFLIVSSQRSGSDYLVTLLNSHPNVTSHSELFTRQRCRDDWKCFTRVLDGVYTQERFYKAQEGSSAKELGQGIKSRHHADDIVAFKWMVSQKLLVFTEEAAEYLRDHNIKVVFLWRCNLLRMIASQRANRSSKTDEHATAHPRSEKEASRMAAAKPVLDPTTLVSRFKAEYRKRGQVEMQLRKTLGNDNIFTLHYENITSKNAEIKRNALCALERFLGIPPIDSGLHTDLVAIHKSMATPYEEIDNGEMIIQLLKGTPFQTFVDNWQPEYCMPPDPKYMDFDGHKGAHKSRHGKKGGGKHGGHLAKFGHGRNHGVGTNAKKLKGDMQGRLYKLGHDAAIPQGLKSSPGQ